MHRRGVRLLREDRVASVGFDVFPIKSPSGETSFLVLFLDMPRPTAETARANPAREPETAVEASGQVEALERELSEMREYARAVLEDKESANEELRSANEELQSANEELQSVNEELETTSEEVQSANEELRTVNEELESASEQRSKSQRGAGGDERAARGAQSRPRESTRTSFGARGTTLRPWSTPCGNRCWCLGPALAWSQPAPPSSTCSEPAPPTP